MSSWLRPPWRRILNGLYVQTRLETSVGSNGTKKIVLAEDKIVSLLRGRFPEATFIQVTDVSGGCGAMFEVAVESYDFKGLSIVKQHRLVNEILKDEIKEMHGIRIHTSIPIE